MADVRTSFAILEDATSQAGLPLHKVLEGDAIASKNALPALVAKYNDAGTDKFRYLKVDANGMLLVNTESGDVAELYANGTHVGDKDAFQTIAEITLTADSDYKNLNLWASCYRDTVFKIDHLNDATPTTLVTAIRVGSGCVSFAGIMKQVNFTAGSTGVQKLILKGKNDHVASSMSGVIGIDEAL